MASRNAVALGRLADWAERFERIASPQYKAALTRDLSKKTHDLIQEGFRKESTPYGQKWRPKKIPNGEKILVAHSNPHMRDSFKTRVGIGRFEIENPKPYFNTHQFGDSSRNIPQRQMYPFPSRLPIEWVRVYTKTFMDKTFRIISKGKKK